MVKESVSFKVSCPGESNGEVVDPRLGEPYRMIKHDMLCDVFVWHGHEDDETRLKSIEHVPANHRVEHSVKPPKFKPVANWKITGQNPISEERLAELKAMFRARVNSKEWHIKCKAARERSRKHIMNWAENEEEIYRDRDIACAKAAVEYYNKKHRTDYEIVETLGSYCAAVRGIIYHCNFRAQRINHGRSRPPVPQLFFAEFKHHIDADSVNTCVIVYNPALGHGLPGGCTMCRGQLRHPVNYIK